ncbi:helix-turn-helix domain-containing protein [Paracoccus yeei]|nr:helix-turn-helix domain-containing protein [Paracoccus yeei]
MPDDVDAIVSDLKKQFGVQSDQDLARHLHLGRSTISSWKARGAVPARYKRILSGEPASFALEPKEMTEEEGLALSLAIMRLMKSHGSVISDQRTFIVSAPHLWNLLLQEYHKALEDFTVQTKDHGSFHGWVNKFNVLAYDEFFGASHQD